jgi:4-amino-4-deoxy-L-arabinose transferase-like glycosyltransferase
MLSSARKDFNTLLSSDPGQNTFAILVLLLFFVFSALSVWGRDKTIDERRHYRYGMNILHGNSTRFDDSKMPVSAWNALPAKIAESFPNGLLKSVFSSYILARLMTTVFSMVTGYGVYLWTRKLYGFIPALFALGLYVLDPNIIAHSQLVTTDVYVMGMILISSYCLWKFARDRRWQAGVILCVMLGLTQLTKYTALALYPLFAIALLAHDWSDLRSIFHSAGWRGIAKEASRYLQYALAALLVSILILNIGFLFNGTFKSFAEYHFRSELFQAWQQKVSIVIPTPYPFLEGLDWVIHRERTGIGYGSIYLLGRLQDHGFPGYYLIASLYKEPIATQLFMSAACFTYFLKPHKRQSFWSKEIFLLLPVLFFSIYFNFFYNAQIGIRYYLVVFPLLFVFTGSLFSNWNEFFPWQKLLSISLMLYLAVSVLSYYPYYITYFNELVWDKTQTYKIIADSNLDWGQSRSEVDKYFAEHPSAKPPSAKPESGLFVVAVNRLVGISTDPQRFAWLRENFEPVGIVANYYLIYDISQEEITHLCETTEYCD